MKKLSKKHQLAVQEALKQPKDFEDVLRVHGYVVVNESILHNLVSLVKEHLNLKRKKKCA
jgi:FtsZ-interacting cell division protein YlmF